MALDTRIALGIQPPEFRSPLELAARGMQLQTAQRQNQLGQMQLDEARAAQAEKEALRNYLAGGADLATPEGQQGLYKAAPLQAGGILKSRAEVAKEQALTQKAQVEGQAKQLELQREKIAFQLQRMPTNPAEVPAWYQSGVQSGLIGMKEATAEMQKVPTDPSQFAQWREQQMRAGMTLTQQFDLQMKQLAEQRQAATLQETIADNQRTDQRIRSEGAANRGVQMRGQDITRDAALQGGTVQVDAAGNMVVVPNKIRPGEPTKVSPVVTPEGKPVQGKGKDDKITEGERNASGYALRMSEATKLLDQFEGTGRETYTTRAAGAAGNAARGTVSGADQQRYRQAAEDWVRAKLRKESGAVIGKDEMEAEIQTYFPMPWDKPENVEQKRQARLVANRAMAQAAGRGFTPEQPAPKTDIDALLDKYK